MWEANGKGRSETRENEGSTGSTTLPQSGDHDRTDWTASADVSPRPRLRNLTGREYRLIFRRDDGTEVVRRIPPELTKVRVKYNRLFDARFVEEYDDPEGSGAKVGMVEAKPRLGVLPTCETIDGLPPPEGGVRLVVDPAVVFALARRGVHRRDLLTLGRLRTDPTTHRVIGFENLSRTDFDAPPMLEVLPALERKEDRRSE